VGGGGVLGVAEVDCGGSEGNLQALAALAAAVARLAPGVGDFEAFAAPTAAVAALEPGEPVSVHSRPRSLSIRSSDSLGLRACALRSP
jgi:hypothetical protein